VFGGSPYLKGETFCGLQGFPMPHDGVMTLKELQNDADPILLLGRRSGFRSYREESLPAPQ